MQLITPLVTVGYQNYSRIAWRTWASKRKFLASVQQCRWPGTLDQLERGTILRGGERDDVVLTTQCWQVAGVLPALATTYFEVWMAMKSVLNIMTAKMEKLNHRDSTRANANWRNLLPLEAISSRSSFLHTQNEICSCIFCRLCRRFLPQFFFAAPF